MKTKKRKEKKVLVHSWSTSRRPVVPIITAESTGWEGPKVTQKRTEEGGHRVKLVFHNSIRSSSIIFAYTVTTSLLYSIYNHTYIYLKVYVHEFPSQFYFLLD